MEDAIIIGAGPAGAGTAHVLGKKGHRVLLVDRATFPRDKVCGECLSPVVVPILRRLGVCFPENTIAYPYRGFSLRDAEGEGVDLMYPHHQPGYSIPRRELDDLIFRTAKKNSSVKTMEGFQVTGTRWFAAEKFWEVEGISGKEKMVFKSRCLVAADGNRSLFLSKKNSSPATRLCLLARFSQVKDVKQLMECGLVRKGLQYVMSPQGADKVLICFVLTGTPKLSIPTEELLKKWVLEIPGLKGRFVDAVLEEGVKGAVLRRYAPPTLVGDGFVRVGDTAGFMDPITGEGIYRALRSAELAGSILSNALGAGDFSKRALKIYEQKMKNEFRWIYRFIALCAWGLNQPWFVPKLIRFLKRHPDMATQVAAIQGGIASPQSFFLRGLPLWMPKF